mmetsp:Transcript_100604/g.194296  ORF Transcript_100604/g.194296 Transcript_100604/m.194296 type:complete len:258 (-) Transcript_100604:68-841(-)
MMKVIAAVLTAIGCAILIGLLAFMGVEVEKLTQIGPCMSDASKSVADLANMPEIIKRKQAEVQAEINILMEKSKNTTAEYQAKIAEANKEMNFTKAQALLAESTQEAQKLQGAQANLTTKMTEIGLSLKTETCNLGKKIPEKFVGCASDVEKNFLFKTFAPSDMPSTDSITDYVDKLMADTGCANDANDTNSSEATEEQATGGSSGFPGWAVFVLALLALGLLIGACVLCFMNNDGEDEEYSDDEEQREIRAGLVQE